MSATPRMWELLVCRCVCRDCGAEEERMRGDFGHSPVPRCTYCGGVLDECEPPLARGTAGTRNTRKSS